MSAASATETKHIIWSPSGKPVSIHVNPRVLARLRPGPVPPDGSRPIERGGLLLGYAREIGEKWLIAVEDSKEIRLRHQRNESWGIADDDRAELQSALREWGPERRRDLPHTVGWYRTHTRAGLYLDESDFRFFLEYFPPPANVALALSADEGGFFFWEEGDMQRSRPCETFRLPEPPVAAVVRQRAPMTAPRRAWLAAPVVAGAMIGLLWNPDPLRRPTAAQVSVTEIPLVDPAEPRAVFAPPSLPEDQWPADQTNPIPVLPSEVKTDGSSYRARAISAPLEEARQVRKLQVPTTRITAAEPVLDIEAPMIADAAREYHPVVPQRKETLVLATMEPGRPSAIRRVVGSIPGFGFIKRRKQGSDNENFTPPRALKEVSPRSPGGLLEEVPVRVRMLLDAEGRVERAELLTRKVEPGLARAAVDAAQGWRFEPARVDDKPVASEMVVQFVFPASTPGGGL
ncbi:MAG: TonB family protein [Bryobacteraceae bacterium]|nr:TonB family protein [Bryobacteraceae bacterium]